ARRCSAATAAEVEHRRSLRFDVVIRPFGAPSNRKAFLLSTASDPAAAPSADHRHGPGNHYTLHRPTGAPSQGASRADRARVFRKLYTALRACRPRPHVEARRVVACPDG